MDETQKEKGEREREKREKRKEEKVNRAWILVLVSEIEGIRMSHLAHYLLLFAFICTLPFPFPFVSFFSLDFLHFN
jgi:hypothetical protein